MSDEIETTVSTAMGTMRIVVPAPIGVKSLHDTCREHVFVVLDLCHGNKSLAARLLGIDRRSIYRWIANTPPKNPYRRSPSGP